MPGIVLPLLVSAAALADSAPADFPGAARRTNAENFKDRVLASCIARAYRDAPAASKDASITASILTEWTYFDLDKAGSTPDSLVEQFLKRDYHNPIEGYEGARFDLLKCLDLYHSRELEAEVRAFVPHPNWLGSKRR
jgi:hypothetical protein